MTQVGCDESCIYNNSTTETANAIQRYIQKSVEINQHGILKVLRQPTGRQAKENTNGNQRKEK